MAENTLNDVNIQSELFKAMADLMCPDAQFDASARARIALLFDTLASVENSPSNNNAPSSAPLPSNSITD